MEEIKDQGLEQRFKNMCKIFEGVVSEIAMLNRKVNMLTSKLDKLEKKVDE